MSIFSDTKSFVVSKTLGGILLIAVGLFLSFLESKGITFAGSSQDLVDVLLQLIGIVVAIYGRFAATKKITV